MIDRKVQITTALAINNLFHALRGLLRRERFGELEKMRKRSSRWRQMQLLVLECILNFPKCFITQRTHTWSMKKLFICMISEEKFPPLIFNGKKNATSQQNWVMQHLRALENLLSMFWTESEHRIDLGTWFNWGGCVKEKQKSFHLSFLLERKSRPECLWCSGQQGPLLCTLGELSFKQARLR